MKILFEAGGSSGPWILALGLIKRVEDLLERRI
jgi:hypothetical protein